jgi:hypothetical protein
MLRSLPEKGIVEKKPAPYDCTLLLPLWEKVGMRGIFR